MSLGEGNRESGVRQCAWHADRTAWGRLHTPGDDHFDPFRVGLDHLALAVENPSKLEDLQRDLTRGVNGWSHSQMVKCESDPAVCMRCSYCDYSKGVIYGTGNRFDN